MTSHFRPLRYHQQRHIMTNRRTGPTCQELYGVLQLHTQSTLKTIRLQNDQACIIDATSVPMLKINWAKSWRPWSPVPVTNPEGVGPTILGVLNQSLHHRRCY
ncbi:unnamed protein product [Dibothriocephalus latus]|uniref:Uncharacterized protein n=1 Tax=Dibothriocephalus latus TaxID=60516 RepID=A0A3P6QSA5_DIBLA|nr:unnamed protein product [Dibothriocephalus latus]